MSSDSNSWFFVFLDTFVFLLRKTYTIFMLNFQNSGKSEVWIGATWEKLKV